MTDNEIIKAFEICYLDSEEECESCPYLDEEGFCKDVPDSQLLRDTLDLINRQKAEIERLNLENLQMVASIKNLKSEAIKEFAERLRKEATVDDDSTWWIANVDIDNLVKEMTEVKE